MKILHVTDIHFKTFVFSWISEQQDNYDVICLTGDFLDERNEISIEEQIKFIRQWVLSVKTPIFLCSGNHDIVNESYDWLADLPRSDGSITTINNIVIGCASEDCEDFYRYRDCDILLHHYPPAKSQTAIDQLGVNHGSDVLKSDMSLLNCKYILCGHVHRPVARARRNQNIVIYNAGGNHKKDRIRYLEFDIE
ncbi:metallophosphoesterase family protein [Wohlfahrtiimonas chitiniclastica]|uniref:metallophosphoesterase family protein n=1 Tax=Wohlfahrtiimonas chitiniclastica TaxID=400946 RepID=UPI000B9825F1|nr:metallophosphoesterase [Wohlfahrtiimonas chitiniclastica]MBS7836290.1 metallophosphoesterase [Wohlfahrtiimonas chitiniclastica]OYQ89687.1 hypothetical protein B9T21_02755 [Wohlfahrtiimonas chitiniclastica]